MSELLHSDRCITQRNRRTQSPYSIPGHCIFRITDTYSHWGHGDFVWSDVEGYSLIT